MNIPTLLPLKFLQCSVLPNLGKLSDPRNPSVCGSLRWSFALKSTFLLIQIAAFSFAASSRTHLVQFYFCILILAYCLNSPIGSWLVQVTPNSFKLERTGPNMFWFVQFSPKWSCSCIWVMISPNWAYLVNIFLLLLYNNTISHI